MGSRYILSDRYIPLPDIAAMVREVVPAARVPRVMPYAVARILTAIGEPVSRIVKKPPMLPAGQLHFLTSHVVPDNTRARTELGWTNTPTTEAIAATLAGRG